MNSSRSCRFNLRWLLCVVSVAALCFAMPYLLAFVGFVILWLPFVQLCRHFGSIQRTESPFVRIARMPAMCLSVLLIYYSMVGPAIVAIEEYRYSYNVEFPGSEIVRAAFFPLFWLCEVSSVFAGLTFGYLHLWSLVADALGHG